MSATGLRPPARQASDLATGFVLASLVVGHLWIAFGVPRGRLVLAVVTREDLIGRQHIQDGDVEMALVRVRRGEQWLQSPALAAGRFVRPTPSPGAVDVVIRAREPVYASQIVTRFPLPTWEHGLPVVLPASSAGSIPHANLRPEDRVAVYITSSSPEPEAGKAGTDKATDDAPPRLVARAMRVLGVDNTAQGARPVLWVTGSDAHSLAREMLAPSAKVLLIRN